MNQTVKVSRGEVMGIGKVKIPRTTSFNYEIPMLSFLVIKKAEGGFVSSCMHLQIDGYGPTDEHAVTDMVDSIKTFLNINFEELSVDDAWLNLIDASRIDKGTIELWNAYREVQFIIASMGLPTDRVEVLEKKITQMQRQIDWLKAENTVLKAGLEELIVEYTPLQKAA